MKRTNALILFLFFITATISFPQTSHWRKIIPKTNVEVKYFSPVYTNDFISLDYVKSRETNYGSVQSYANDKLNVDIYFIYYDNYIDVTGQINNLVDNDACLTIKIVFPFDQNDTIYWDHSPDSTTMINVNQHYENFIEAYTIVPPDGAFNISDKYKGGYGEKIGIGKTSFYPIASISTLSLGLGWGIDLGLPIVYRLSYETSSGMIAEFDAALSKETIKFPNSAFFKLQLFEHEPEWHFRAALKKYYEINPIYFKKRVIEEGIWLPFTPLYTISDFEDFGIAFHETDWKAKDKGFKNEPTIIADKYAGVYSFQYTEPWDVQIPIANTKLSYDKIISDGVITQKQRKYLQNSVTLDNAGLWQTRKLNTPWFNTGWAVSITTNASPYLKAYSRFDNIREEEIDPAINLGVDGIYFDSMEWNWHNDLNYNRSHFNSTNYPLTFSSSLENPPPAIWNYSSEYEAMSFIAQEMHLKGKLTMGNGFGWNPFAAGVLDLFGSEISWSSKESSDKKRLLFLRSISYQKPIVFLLNEGLDDPLFTTPPYIGYEKYFEKMLAFGLFPSFFSVDASSNPYWRDSTKYNIGRPFFKKYIPLIKVISKAGWEPITYATTNSNDISIERFGDNINDGLYFTIYNYSSADKQVDVYIDSRSLKLNPVRKIVDMNSGKEFSFLLNNENIVLSFTIGTGKVILLKIIN